MDVRAPIDLVPDHRVTGAAEAVADGPFAPTWEGLTGYRAPDWFRDAKFGIWAHWGPQCAPEAGDWYARRMYVQGDEAYRVHLQEYGHPSEVGFKDVIQGWRAENWDPADVVARFAAAGARYVVAMANHHDNFDLWDSRHHAWNSTRLGPRRDVVAGWAGAARAAGLPFGVTVHAAHAWTWYETSRGSDTDGPLAGVPYDGALRAEQGTGTWWEGLDPQDLYAQRHPLSDGAGDPERAHGQWAWGDGASRPDEEFCRRFHDRTIDLVNQVEPDLLYFDDTALPLWPVSDAGLRIAAHFYNSSVARHGENRAVLLGKVLTDEQKTRLTWDVERGAPEDLQELPWQTDTCIGHWHYDAALAGRHGYKSALTVVQTLVDVVSKNGNLLLSVPVRGDGTIDQDEQDVLTEVGEWVQAHGEAVFGTRPFQVAGEGPSLETANPVNAQGFNEGRVVFTAQDIRYTRDGDTVYAFPLLLPGGTVRLTRLGHDAFAADVVEVSWLGSAQAPQWQRTPDALEVSAPRTPDEPGRASQVQVLRVRCR
ncbi:alpha-L-fucosidase [Kineococcus sp. SYSU DK001]|uniref:alpha-L-fucosidase n=1 Tax=Kineococcus sp. SYSU DK001 TaxID=3383122 RepID=UPI003D7E64FB